MGRHAIPDRAADVALRLGGVTKTFRSGVFGRGPRVAALRGIDLEVQSGTVHALLGPNGAGKTTTVRAIATLMRPDAGTVVVDGVDALAEPDTVREMIGVSGQYAAVDGNLTGFENLRMVAQLYGHTRGEAARRARTMIADLNLEDAADRPMRTYSGGMRRRLDLAGALINEPSLVILDEPTTGLDPRGRRQMWDVITEQVAAGTTVLLTTQYLEEADALADEITVIDNGTVRAQGTAAQLKAITAQSILTVEIGGQTTRDDLVGGYPARSDADRHDDTRVHTESRVRTALGEIGIGSPRRVGSDTWTVPVADGTRSAVAAVRACDDLGIDVLDATVSTPTLDDVFLELTGRADMTGEREEELDTPADAAARLERV